MSPTPVIMIGLIHTMVARAADMIKPEYDMIHAMLSYEQAITDLPLILSSPPKAPPNVSDNIGSRNYSYPKVAAVIVGGGFNDEQFKQLRDSCGGLEDQVVWIRPDMSKLSGMPPFEDENAFGKEIGVRVKAKMNELGVATEGGEKSGVFYWN